jgi:hypothetical protein
VSYGPPVCQSAATFAAFRPEIAQLLDSGLPVLAYEAVIDVFIELNLIATFSNRFLIQEAVILWKEHGTVDTCGAVGKGSPPEGTLISPPFQGRAGERSPT